MFRAKPLYEVRKTDNIKDMIYGSFERYAANPAFWTKEDDNGYQPTTYAKLKEDLECLGTALLELGLGGCNVAVLGDNCYQWMLVYLAVVCGVGVVVPIDKDLPAEDIGNIIAEAEVKAIFHADKYSDKVKKAIGQAPCLTQAFDRVSFYIEKGRKAINSGARNFLEASVGAEDVAALLYTSGTMGKSKGVVLSHRNIAANICAMRSMVYVGQNDIFMSVLPVHHTYECTCGNLCPLYCGASVAFCEGLRRITKNLNQSGATIMLGVPLLFENMYRKILSNAKKSGQLKKLRLAMLVSAIARQAGVDISWFLFKRIHASIGANLRLLISGAAGIDPVAAGGLRNLGFMLLQGYGLTECSPIAAVNRDVHCKLDSVGLPLPGTCVKIANANEDGVGELIISGPNVMVGYYKDQQATAKAIRNGWFYSGDLGKIDKDGFVYICGRKKNVIIAKNGKNVYPEELEMRLCQSRFIDECMVYGKQVNGDTIICAAIRIAPELGELRYSDKENRQIIEKEIIKINEEMPIYKKIRSFNIRKTEFAKTTTMKIKRHMENNNEYD